MEQAILLLMKDGMTREEATTEFNERCAYCMRGYDGTSRRYAEKLVLDELTALNEDDI